MFAVGTATFVVLQKEASSEELTLDVQTKVHSFNSKQNDSTK
jgi:hypothetical protein